MIIQILNTIGLALGIIGVLIIFKWGPPQPDLGEGTNLLAEDDTPINSTGKTSGENDIETMEKRRKYKRRSRLGLFLIMVGFIIQLIAVWL